MAIEVPRDEKLNNHVTKDIENYLLDLFAQDPEQPFTRKEMLYWTKKKFGGQYGNDLEPHVSWALNMLDYNKLIKKVAPGTYESVDGPDDEFQERETGYSPEGEFQHRSHDTTRDTSKPKNKEDFKHEMFKSDFGARTLKNLGKDEAQVEAAMMAAGFNPVCIKLALKKYFKNVDVGME